jgi:hypothetical protein
MSRFHSTFSLMAITFLAHTNASAMSFHTVSTPVFQLTQGAAGKAWNLDDPAGRAKRGATGRMLVEFAVLRSGYSGEADTGEMRSTQNGSARPAGSEAANICKASNSQAEAASFLARGRLLAILALVLVLTLGAKLPLVWP